jgi:endonuclease VIII
MPEGDTVLRAAQTLDRALAGRTVLRSDFRVPRLATASLTGQHVLDVVARGKHLLLHTDAALTLHTHFLMDGMWYLYKPGEKWSGGAGHQIRVVLDCGEWIAVGYRLGIVELYPTDEESRHLGDLGPDILAADFDADEAVRRLRARPHRPIAEALLDQGCIAGIGNIYKNESLFLERVDPHQAVGEVADLHAVVARARKLMQYSVASGRQCTTGTPPQPFYVFERAGRPCRRCRTPIRVERVPPAQRIADADSGRAGRITYWCPRCQPG